MSVFPLLRLGGDGGETSLHRGDPALSARDECPSLSRALASMKDKIDTRGAAWDAAKRATNPYEYIHTAGPRGRPPVASKRPLSRSYFKMVELGKTFDLFSTPAPLRSMHLAEGPGGFIEACVDMRQGARSANDKYVGITLVEDVEGVPGWRRAKRFLSGNADRVAVETGPQQDGNILSIKMHDFLAHKYGGWATLVTADGGVDFSSNYADQERTALPLVVAEVCHAMTCQAPGGTFILKMFDTFRTTSAELLCFLAHHYDSVSIVKPCTSRAANSERYVVAERMRRRPPDGLLAELLAKVVDGNCPERLFQDDIPPFFLNGVRETSSVIGQRQLDNMLATFDTMDGRIRSSTERVAEAHYDQCARWCAQHSLPRSQKGRANIFLGNQEAAGASGADTSS
jgi:23S rRNA U2552 (ribose-2'-O)-methylase RlmE/FtsJ